MFRAASVAMFFLALPLPVRAEVIGQMQSAPPIAPERIDSLQPDHAAAWRAYLSRSAEALRADQAALADERVELARSGGAIPPHAPVGNTADILTLDREANWYAGVEARALADNIVSFQTPSGGWGKNQDRTGPVRLPSQSYVADDLDPSARAGSSRWSYVGTIDNDATLTEIAFLSRVQASLPGPQGHVYRRAILRGLDYLFAAELPGGGWPQVYPLQGGYHDMLTLNDDALVQTVQLLRSIATGESDYAFVPQDMRDRAADVVARTIALLLELQVTAQGRPTIWAQQYDPLTRAPVAARKFEPAALSTAESARVLLFLMEQDDPDETVRKAIRGGAAWFAANALADVAWRATEDGRRQVPEPGAKPLWPRYVDPSSGRPVFGDRDGTIHDDVNDLSRERRDGYSWFNTSGEAVARAYKKWAARHRLLPDVTGHSTSPSDQSQTASER